MPTFNNKRQTIRGGAYAGRGDDPHAKPHAKLVIDDDSPQPAPAPLSSREEKRKKKALKKIKPLAINPSSTEGDSSERRFMPSEQGLHFLNAQVADQRRPSGYNLLYNKTNKEVVDEYTKTGKITSNDDWDKPTLKPQL